MRPRDAPDGCGVGGEGLSPGWPRHGITEEIPAAASAIEVPVLVLAGQDDRVDPVVSMEANLLQVIPGARSRVAPTAAATLAITQYTSHEEGAAGQFAARLVAA